VGKGAYATVCSGRDKTISPELGQMAIKKIERPFENKLFVKRCLREIKIARYLNQENVVLFFLKKTISDRY